MGAQAQVPSSPRENPVKACASRLAGIYQAPQTFFPTEEINTERPHAFIECLRQAVEDISRRGKTVRKANPNLFAEQWFWLHIAVGPYASFGPSATIAAPPILLRSRTS